MHQDNTAYYLNQAEPNRSCLLALRNIILGFDTHISETVKYGMPCFCYINKPFCYLWTDKKTDEPYILMAKGKQLHHPELKSGNRARMKIFSVSPSEDIPADTIENILQEAIDLYRKGIVAN